MNLGKFSLSCSDTYKSGFQQMEVVLSTTQSIPCMSVQLVSFENKSNTSSSVILVHFFFKFSCIFTFRCQ